jgi:HK97 family phage major capsid protein
MAQITKFTRFAIALMRARGDVVMAAEFAKKWDAQPEIAKRIKSLIDPGSTSNPAWGGVLAPVDTVASEFVALLRPATVIGRMLGFRPAVFNTRMPTQTAGASVGWVGQRMSAPASSLAFDEATLMTSKLGGIVVISDELARSSDPAAELIIQSDLIAATAEFSDVQLLDPTIVEVADTSPASITNGAPTFVSSGSDMDSIEDDLKLLVGSLNDAGIRFLAPYFIMRPSTALHLATLRDVASGGQRLFPDMGVLGGRIWGIPVLVSANVPVDVETPHASYVVLVDAAEMLLADGGIELDASKHASVQLKTDPATGAQTLVNLWQKNMVGTRITRFIRWQMRRTGAVAVLSGVNY